MATATRGWRPPPPGTLFDCMSFGPAAALCTATFVFEGGLVSAMDVIDPGAATRSFMMTGGTEEHGGAEGVITVHEADANGFQKVEFDFRPWVGTS